LIHQKFHQALLYQKIRCLFIFLVIWDLIPFYSGHIKSISCETPLNIRLDFIPKGIELFPILSLILCFAINLVASNSFFFFQNAYVNFHILKFPYYHLK